MEITYSKDYDKLIRELAQKINDLNSEKIKEMILFYKDNNMSCVTCRYSWLQDVGDVHICCEKGNCIICVHNKYGACNKYKESNDTSEFLKQYAYEAELASAYDDMFAECLADASLEKAKKFCEMYFEE